MDYRDRDHQMSYSVGGVAETYDQGLRSFLLGVYNYMASALALTGIVAYLAANYPPLTNALYHFQDGRVVGYSGLGMLTIIASIGFIIVLCFGINRLSLSAAQGVFWAYAAAMGLFLSSIFLVYTGASIMRVFFITAIMFGSMSIWGYSTKKDLTSMGHFLMMGLWGIIIAMVVNMFMQSSALDFAVSILGVVIFTGLTAFDTQALKVLYYRKSDDAATAGKSAIMGALTLYLDFINLFLYMLRFLGDRR